MLAPALRSRFSQLLAPAKGCAPRKAWNVSHGRSPRAAPGGARRRVRTPASAKVGSERGSSGGRGAQLLFSNGGGQLGVGAAPRPA